MMAFYLLASLLLVGYHVYLWRGIRPYREAAPVALALDGNVPLLSMLVPAWNAVDDVAAFVEAYRAVAYPRLELVLCAGGADGSLEAARRLACATIKVLDQHPGEGKQGALARSFAASAGELVYLTDIDCRPDTDSLLRVLKPILEGREAVVTGSSAPLERQRHIGAVLIHWATVRQAAGEDARYIDGLLGRNCAVTRAAVLATGAFGFAAPTGTDYRFAQELVRTGHRIWFEPRSEIGTEYAWPLATYVRKRGRWIRNVVLFAERPRQRAELRGAVINIALPLTLLVLLGLALLTAQLWPAFVALALVAHGLLNRLRYARALLSPRYVGPGLAAGAFLNLFGTLVAGLHAAITLLSPALRRKW